MALSDDGEWLLFRDHQHVTIAQASKAVALAHRADEPEPRGRRRAPRNGPDEGHAV
jgi:hypothetical protein